MEWKIFEGRSVAFERAYDADDPAAFSPLSEGTSFFVIGRSAAEPDGQFFWHRFGGAADFVVELVALDALGTPKYEASAMLSVTAE
jgi:hypothetical protein